jgi:hypothetical protein
MVLILKLQLYSESNLSFLAQSEAVLPVQLYVRFKFGLWVFITGVFQQLLLAVFISVLKN